MTETHQEANGRWTPEMDAYLSSSISGQRTAREIAAHLGVTRNAVLGRTFRLGLSVARVVRQQVESKQRYREIGEIIGKTPEQVKERISDLRDFGCSWNAISRDLGVTVETVRRWALKLGIFQPTEMRRFTPEDHAYIIAAWQRNEHVDDIADNLGRSFGVIRQEVLRLQRSGALGTRDPAKTRLLRKYGEAALSAGGTPQEALRNIAKAKTIALSAAMTAARAAKQRRYDLAIEKMRQQIAEGRDRNAAIFEARAEGVQLEVIAKHFGVTRERIRQVCNAHAEKLALEALVSK